MKAFLPRQLQRFAPGKQDVGGVFRLALAGLAAWTAAAADLPPAAGPDRVRNGSFEAAAEDGNTTAGWTTAGDRGVRQTLTLAPGRDGGRCAKLECTEFAAGSPASHAMVCQLGVVGATRGQWECPPT